MDDNQLQEAFIRGMENNDKAVVEDCLKRGANPNYIAREANQITLLHILVHYKKLSFIDILVQYGGDLNAQDHFGQTPLTMLNFNRSNASVIEKLLKLGADPSIKNKRGDSLLDKAVASWSSYSRWVSPDKETRDLLNLADLIINFHNHVTPKKDLLENQINEKLLKAAKNGSHHQLKEFIAQGADLEYTDNDGNTALLLATKNGSRTCIDLLLKSHADTAHCNNEGEGVLHISAFHGHVELIKLFIDNGNDVNQKTNTGKTALIYSLSNNNDNVETVECLINYGASLNVSLNRNGEPIHFAIKNLNINCIKFLINTYVDVNFSLPNNDNPVLYASLCLCDNKHNSDKKRLKYTEIIDMLVKNGANINIDNEFNDSAIASILYSRIGEPAMCKLLSSIFKNSKYDIDLNIQLIDYNKKSLIELAQYCELNAVTQLFKSYQESAILMQAINNIEDNSAPTIGI